MNRKLIVIDLDETLLRTNKTYDKDRFKMIKEYLDEENSVLCIATGNSYHKIPDYFTESERHNIYFACDNGNYILKNDEVIHRQGIPYEILLDIVTFTDEFEGFHPVVSIGEKSYFRSGHGPAYDHVVKYNNNLEIIDDFSELDKDDLAMKIAYYSPESLSRNKIMSRIISEKYEEVDAVTSGDQWLDLYVKGGGKGSAVKYLQEKYDISQDSTMVFGDSLNDQSMLHEAKYSVAMANADEDLIMSASYLIGSNNDQAVIDVLETYTNLGNFDFMAEYYRF